MELNENQKKAAEFNGTHLLLLAGAGTGKTKTIIARATYLINNGVDPSKIQILTFTKRAAGEIVSRVKANLSNNEAKNLNGSTFHSWCNQLINRFPNLFGTNNYTIIDEDDQLSILKLVCGKNKLQFEEIKLKPQSLLDLYSFARNTKRNLSDTIKLKLLSTFPESNISIKLGEIKPKVETILRDYEIKKRDRKYLDYDDMLQVVANKLNKDENARQIVSNHYSHLLIDEMQDTNPLQWELIKPFQEMCSLFCVGDDAQSIYSFRGADFQNIHKFKNRVENSEIYKLEDNYRSTQEILDLSNWLLEKSILNYDKKLRAIRGKGKKPQIYNLSNEWEEAYFIAEKIAENISSNNKNFNDHLILTRSMFYTRPLQAVFIERKIPFETFGGRGFMESAHIKDVFSAFRIVNNIVDEIAWIRFLTFWGGIGEVKASKYISKILLVDSIEQCIEIFVQLNGESETKIANTLKSINESKLDIPNSIKVAYQNMEQRFVNKYADDWENKRKGDFPVLEILGKNYSNLNEFITECLLDNSPTLNKSKIIKSEGEKDKVIISTIHSAKGLESDSCFVLNVSPKVYPSSWNLGNIDAIEEDRRLLYVAMTRAKNELYITREKHSIYAESYSIDPNNIIESYFLNSLPEEFVEQNTISNEKNKFQDIEENQDIDNDYGIDFG
jgi:DNA helicase-2/ATP-dependent DNA helicase PcrA